MLTGQLWKIATGFATVISLALMISLALTIFENRALEERIETVVSNLNQSRSNEATLSTSLDEQNKQWEQQAKDDAKLLAQVKAQLAATQVQNEEFNARWNKMLKLPPRGANLQERVSDIDNRFLETLQ